jgi:hypothetical protein
MLTRLNAQGTLYSRADELMVRITSLPQSSFLVVFVGRHCLVVLFSWAHIESNSAPEVTASFHSDVERLVFIVHSSEFRVSYT